MAGRWLRQAQNFFERVSNPIPSTEKRLFQFATAADLSQWRTFSDADVGGKSTAELVANEKEPTTALFRGHYDTSIAEGAAAQLKRSGYAGITTKHFEDSLDVDDYDELTFRVLGDGNRYIASLRTENWVVGDDACDDVWQAFLFARPGEWSDVSIPLSRFALTHRGRLVEAHMEMNRLRIRSFSLAVATPSREAAGEYCLGLDWIEARNTTRLDSPWAQP